MEIPYSTFEQTLRKIIQEEVRPIINEELAPIKLVLGQHGVRLREINSTLATMKNTLRAHSREIRRVADKVEELDDRFRTAAQIS